MTNWKAPSGACSVLTINMCLYLLLWTLFGFLAPEAVNILKRVQKVMHSNVVSPRSQDIVFNRIGFAILKGLARSLLHVYLLLKCNYLTYIKYYN
jgi:hypothetical protein